MGRSLLTETYTIIDTIGKGAFGEALLVKRIKDNKALVVKSFPVNTSRDWDKAAREIEILKRLSHPNIIRYCDHLEEEDGIYLVMEYAAGGDLRARILQKKGNGRFPQTDVVAWFSQLLLAVKHLHDCKILHRDIKPANIFFTSKSVVKLGDFGLTKVLEGTSLANTCCGTPYFFSPEIVEKVPYNSKSDMWAVGCMLYEMMMLQHPFQGASMKALYEAIRTVKFIPLDDHYCAELRNIVESIFRRNPAERPSAVNVLSFPIIKKYLKHEILEPTAPLQLTRDDQPRPSSKGGPRSPLSPVREASSSWMTQNLSSMRGNSDLEEGLKNVRAALKERKTGGSPADGMLTGQVCQGRIRPQRKSPTKTDEPPDTLRPLTPREEDHTRTMGKMHSHVQAFMEAKPDGQAEEDMDIVEKAVVKYTQGPVQQKALKILGHLGKQCTFERKCELFDQLLWCLGPSGGAYAQAALHRLVFGS